MGLHIGKALERRLSQNILPLEMFEMPGVFHGNSKPNPKILPEQSSLGALYGAIKLSEKSKSFFKGLKVSKPGIISSLLPN